MSNDKQNHIVEVNKMVSSIDKEFVPYEQALELKEIGFDEHCFGFYNICGFNINTHIKNSDDLISIEFERIKYHLCTTPTFAQAFRWFDENTELMGFIVPSIKDGHFDWLIRIGWDEELECEEVYSSRLQAELECLKKLIEIVKEKQNEQK